MTNATIINTKTGAEYPVKVVTKTAAFAKVSYNGGSPIGFSRRADGRWFETGATRKGEQTMEVRF